MKKFSKVCFSFVGFFIVLIFPVLFVYSLSIVMSLAVCSFLLDQRQGCIGVEGIMIGMSFILVCTYPFIQFPINLLLLVFVEKQLTIKSEQGQYLVKAIRNTSKILFLLSLFTTFLVMLLILVLSFPG